MGSSFGENGKEIHRSKESETAVSGDDFLNLRTVNVHSVRLVLNGVHFLCVNAGDL